MPSLLEPSNLLQVPQTQPLPQGVVLSPTSDELRSRYEWSKALAGNQQPVKHWSQGVSNMLNSLVGGMIGFDTDAKAREAKQVAPAQNREWPAPGNLPPIYGDAPSKKESVLPGGALGFSPEEDSNALTTKVASLEPTPEKPKSNNLIDRAQAATTKQESGGRYDLVGKGSSKYGPALGRYQILRDNIGPWSKEVLGRDVTPQEFLLSPEIQDAIYKGKMAQYIQKYGVEGAGRAWLGGESGVNRPDRRDALGTSVGAYGKKFATLVGPGGGGPIVMPPVASQPLPFQYNSRALPLSAEPQGAEASDGVRAIATALARGGDPDGPTAAARPIPPPPGAKPLPGPQVAQSMTVPPGLLPGQTRMTPGNMTNIMNNEFVSPAEKAWWLQMYMGTQVNPRAVPYSGGNILVSPDNKTQRVIPDIHWSTERDPSGAQYQYPSQILPDATQRVIEERGGSQGAKPTGPTEAPVLGPRKPIVIPGTTPVAPVVPAPVTPPVAPVVPPVTPPVVRPPVVPPVAPPVPAPVPGRPSEIVPDNFGAELQPSPTSPALALAGQPTAIPGAAGPVEQAAAAAGMPKLNAPAETGAAAIEAAQRALGPGAPAAPPMMAEMPNVSAPMGNTPMGPLTVPPPSALPGEKVAESLVEKRSRLRQEGLEYETAKQDIPLYTKTSKEYMDIGERAKKQMPLIKAAAQVAQDPRFYSGLFADPVQWVQKGLVALNRATGLGTDDKALAAPLEIFEKIISGDIVSELKIQLGGLGQIRLAEIELITKSVANRYNTPAANAAVLMLMERQYDQSHKIGVVAEAYAKGMRVNADGTGFEPRPPGDRATTAGLLGEVRKYTEFNPLLSDDEIKNINQTFNTAKPVPYQNAEERKSALLDGVRKNPLAQVPSLPTAAPPATAAPVAAPKDPNSLESIFGK